MQINVESFAEMEALSRAAVAKGVTAEIAIRINPNVDAKTHDKISTGRKQDKFGIDIELAADAYQKAAELPGLDAAAVAVHIGSQLTSLDPFRAAFTRVAELFGELRAAGHNIRRVDLGGGLGIDYDGAAPPTPAAYAAVIKETVGHLGCRVLLEPGRNLVGNAGILVSRVIYTKDGDDRDFVIVDAAMNDLIRPALYDAYHGIRPVAEPAAVARIYSGSMSSVRSVKPAIPLPAHGIYPLIGGRSADIRQCRCVLCRDGVDLQRAPPRARGLGERRSVFDCSRPSNH